MTRNTLVLALTVVALTLTHPTAQTQGTIPDVITAGTMIEVIRNGFKGVEGPMPTPDGGLYFSDAPTNRIYKLDRNGAISVWRENTNGTNGLYLLGDGRLLAAEADGHRIVAVMADGHVIALATVGSDRAPNDLIPDRKGGIYFTDPSPRPAPDVAPKEPGDLNYLRPDGRVVLLDGRIQRPNGLTLSLDEKTLYVDDTEGEYVYAYDIQSDGSVKNKRPFVKLHDPEKGSLGLRSRADGMGIDSKGRLFVGTGSGVQVIDPKGQYLGTIRMREPIRNVAFGGPDRKILYMTGLETLYRVRTLAEGPVGRPK